MTLFRDAERMFLRVAVSSRVVSPRPSDRCGVTLWNASRDLPQIAWRMPERKSLGETITTADAALRR
jgi:hypothetical protein